MDSEFIADPELTHDPFASLDVDIDYGAIEPESGELLRQAFWFFDLVGAATRTPSVRIPNATVITGALDPMATPEYCQRLVAEYGSGTNLDIVENVGHMAILQGAGVQSIVKRIETIRAAQ